MIVRTITKVDWTDDSQRFKNEALNNENNRTIRFLANNIWKTKSAFRNQRSEKRLSDLFTSQGVRVRVIFYRGRVTSC